MINFRAFVIRTFLLAVVLAVFSCSSGPSRNKRPDRLIRMQENFFHVKGKNEGYWCLAEVHGHHNSARIKIYDVATGKLLQFKRFTVMCNLQTNNAVWIDSLSKQIDYFDGEKFHFKPEAGKDSCWMQ